MEASQRTTYGIVALVLGVLGLGWIGIHKFMMGYKNEGLISLIVSLVTCLIAAPIFTVISIVEGIIYLTKSDEQFYQEYVINRKPWF